MGINRDALKKLSDMNIDCQYAQQVGIKVFNYNEGPNPEFQALCAQLSKVCDDLQSEIQAIKAYIPIQ